MSGGVDSNALISIARKAWNYDVHGFTIVNRDERYDEHEMVEKAVSDLNIRHTAVPLESRDFLHQLRSLVRHHDAPVYTITYFAHWVLMQRIAEHGYRIAISGTGADEIFTGYYDHQSFYLNEVRKDPRHFDASLANWRRYIQPIVRNPVLQDPLAFIRNPWSAPTSISTRTGSGTILRWISRKRSKSSLLRKPAAQPDAERNVSGGRSRHIARR